jgi:Site-specific DNA methylase
MRLVSRRQTEEHTRRSMTLNQPVSARESDESSCPPLLGAAVHWATRPDITPLRYPGGKRKLGPFLAGLITSDGARPTVLAEPFAGGAAVSISLLEAGYTEEIVLSDMDEMVASFWSVVFSPEAETLAEMVEKAEVSVPEWYRLKNLQPTSMMETAFKCLFLNRTSFSGSLHRQAGPMGGRNQAKGDLIGSRFNKARIAKRILELSKLRDRVRGVTCGHYAETMIKHDSPDTLWYLDPPFFAQANRLYRHWFSEEHHHDLKAAIANLKGRWVLSYDDHPSARALYGSHPGFATISLQYTASVGDQRVRKGEIVVSDIIARLRPAMNWVGSDIHVPRRSIRARTPPQGHLPLAAE